MISYVARVLVILCLASIPSLVVAGERISEVLITWGAGSQPNAAQRNSQLSVDYNFYKFQRSSRSGFSLGVSYTRLRSNIGGDASLNDRMEVFSIYPQLNLVPVRESMKNTYFFVRALGPSYLSENSIGHRQQEHHFAFQAQVGVGLRIPLKDKGDMLAQLSWKHFSNANLFSDNDGIDLPFVLSLGFSF